MKNKSTYLLALIFVSFTGCVILDSLGGHKEFAFSHRLHVQEEDLECLDCHIYAEDEEEPGYPKAKQCNLCHKEIDQEQDAEHQISTFYKDGTYVLTHADGFQDEVIFPHVTHVEHYEDECIVCHVGLDDNEVPSKIDPLLMSACVDCHASQGRVDECFDCHKEIDENWTPRNHDLAWESMHGLVSRGMGIGDFSLLGPRSDDADVHRTVDHGHGEATANDCTVCHSEQTCDDCHFTQEPKGHNSYFRRRGHGLQARVDRESCVVCHTPDYCDRCHTITEPVTHNGLFGGTKSNHCVGCHLPLQGESCFTCHKDTPSHLMATPLPGDHNPGMNCRQCHGIDQPLPHADKGDSCINCHM